jgi:HSP20 family molecular chaperone IbpA
MQRQTFELMFDQVRATFRALTGGELPEAAPRASWPPGADGVGEVLRAFAELEAWVRLSGALAERVPPFAFTPAADVYEWDKELVIELAAPGVAPEDVVVERAADTLVISGVRRGGRPDGRHYRRAELPRGPFRRVIHVPHELVATQPRLEVEQGIVRVRLAKLRMDSMAQA